jgi:hypothetical protein
MGASVQPLLLLPSAAVQLHHTGTAAVGRRQAQGCCRCHCCCSSLGCGALAPAAQRLRPAGRRALRVLPAAATGVPTALYTRGGSL